MQEIESAYVDRVAVRALLDVPTSVPDGGLVLARAWEVWGIWANGGFDGLFGNPSGGEVETYIESLDAVGAADHSALLRRAANAFPRGYDGFKAYGEFVDSDSDDARRLNAALEELDREMAQLAPIQQVLIPYLAARPDLVAYGSAPT